MIWCVLFFSLLTFNLGFVCGCFFAGRKREDKTPHPAQGASVVLKKAQEPYKPSVNEKLILDDFSFLNKFTGYNDKNTEKE